MMNNKEKYKKYKLKYLKLIYNSKKMIGGHDKFMYLLSDNTDLLIDEELLCENNINVEISDLHNFIKLKKNLKLYLHKPWDGKSFFEIDKYEQDIHTLLLNKKFKTKEDLEKQVCFNNPISLCQSHGGNIFEHSQWSALHIYIWFNEKMYLTQELEKYKDLLLVAAFFHDIGKAGDCIFNVYDELKYNSKGESEHMFYSSELIMGRLKFILDCQTYHKKELDIKELIKNIFKFNDDYIKIIALTAYMHWEFGKLNIPGNELIMKYSNYVDKFILGFNLYFSDKLSKPFKSIKEINTHLKLNQSIDIIELLKCCIIISCADIASGTNLRVRNNFSEITNFKVSSLKYISKDPWVSFKMNENYLNYSINQIPNS